MSQNGFINKLLEATDNAETPRSYIFWSGIATIAACISPNVWINRGGYYLLSPNLFIILIGESGLGKGLPISIAKKLVGMVAQTRVIAGRNTIQSIVKDLGISKTDEKTGVPQFKDARGFVVSGEFATLFQKDDSALPVLTDLYDCHWNDDWKNTTKGAGVDTLKKVSLTLLGGSTPEHFRNVVPDSDIKGGFLGRMLVVYEEERYRVNPLSDTNGAFVFPYEELAEMLRCMSQLKGPFEYTKAGREAWEEWYTPVRNSKLADPTGAINRLPENVLKVAMCLAISKRLELKINEDDILEARTRCQHLMTGGTKLTGGIGKSATGEQTHHLLKALWRAENYVLDKAKHLSASYGVYDIFELDKAITTLAAAGLVEERRVDGRFYIMMKAEAAKNIAKHMAVRES